MAVFSDIKEFRLQIQDPAGALDLVEVADLINLPSNPPKGYIYKVTSSGAYVSSDKLTGAIATDYRAVDLLLADSRIGQWIDASGVLGAIPYGLKAIIAKLGNDLRIARTGAGAESMDFTSLSELYSYYKDMYDMAVHDAQAVAGINTGVMVTVKSPEIAGGNV